MLVGISGGGSALRETRRRALVDERPVHLLVEIKVKGVERPVGIAEARERVPAVKQAILSAPEFVSDQADTRSIER